MSKLNLDGNIYVISTDSPDNVPAVELDRYTGERSVLLFTSEAKAKKYCYFRCPEATKNIKMLQKRSLRGKLMQHTLLNIARTVLAKYKHVTSFSIDNPGTEGEVQYISVLDVVNVYKDKPDKSSDKPLTTFLDEGD